MPCCGSPQAPNGHFAWRSPWRRIYLVQSPSSRARGRSREIVCWSHALRAAHTRRPSRSHRHVCSRSSAMTPRATSDEQRTASSSGAAVRSCAPPFATKGRHASWCSCRSTRSIRRATRRGARRPGRRPVTSRSVCSCRRSRFSSGTRAVLTASCGPLQRPLPRVRARIIIIISSSSSSISSSSAEPPPRSALSSTFAPSEVRFACSAPSSRHHFP